MISHAHARDLAECWQDAERDMHPVTRLAASGEITENAEQTIAHDLRLLEMASASWGTPPSIPEKQLCVLLEYVRHHGPRLPVDGWRHLRDTEFLRSIRRMASEARGYDAGVDDGPAEPIVDVAPRPRRPQW
ncbi:MAG: hypothetical protein KY460_16035 [Actinobacteria bacterium]|nr:hypothetical protein [Actinomycetota bacterium]